MSTIYEQIVGEIGRLLDLPDFDYLAIAEWNRTFGFHVKTSRGQRTGAYRRVRLPTWRLNQAYADAKADDDYTMDWVGR